MNERITVKSAAEAWKQASEIFGCDYQLDKSRSDRAGHPIYAGKTDVDCWISDLGCRLELNMANGSTICIWIEEEEKRYTAAEVRMIVTEAQKDLDAAERIIEAVKMLDITTVTEEVLERMYRRRRDLKDKLAEFGITR